MAVALTALSSVRFAHDSPALKQTASASVLILEMSRKARNGTTNGSISFPAEPMAYVLAGMLVELVDTFSDSDSANAQRMLVATVLLKLERTTKQLRNLLREHSVLNFYRFFFHTLTTPPATTWRFLDATFGVPLFSGEYGQGPPLVARFDVLSPKEMIQDRVKTAKRLSELDNFVVLQRSKRYIPNDMPSAVCPRVAAFVGRARFLAQRLSVVNPQWRVTCSFASCSEVTIALESGIPPSMLGAPVQEESSSDDDDGDVEPASSGYWSRACPSALARLPRMTFCCNACAASFGAELSTALPIRLDHAETHESFSCASGKMGLPRVLASARAAFKRNACASRSIREATRAFKKRATTSIPFSVVSRLQANVVDVLNIDLAILAAAASLAESPSQCHNRVLPGTAPGWRTQRAWTRAIERIKSIYLRHARQGELVADERFPPMWLRKVKNVASDLFPVVLEQ